MAFLPCPNRLWLEIHKAYGWTEEVARFTTTGHRPENVSEVSAIHGFTGPMMVESIDLELAQKRSDEDRRH